TVNAWRFQSH
ncbi:hypothetical protein VCHC37A1_3147B, partial [Vibrio cholerae HC-37A1]